MIVTGSNIAPITRPSICLNLIVRDEAHVVRELLECVASHIDCWVIVDTGSTDGTQELIREHMAALGIPGELHERPWKDFGHNRSEALALCDGRADYAWVLDADDLVTGDIDLSELTEDSYLLRYGHDFTYWRKQLFRLGLAWRYEGVLHEYVVSPEGSTEARLQGEYHVESRRLGARSADPLKYQRDVEILARIVAKDPHDARAAFYLAQSCFDAGDAEAALEWYTWRVGLVGWDEERYTAAVRRAECMQRLERPWAEVMEAYLEAYQLRPTRAEPLYAIARHYRELEQWDLGYIFAEQAYRLAFPDDDDLFVQADIYRWRAADELAVCAFHVGWYDTSFALCREILALDGLDPGERERIAANRDFCIPALLESSGRYPAEIVQRLAERSEDEIEQAQVTLSVTTFRRLALFERSMNSFLNSCQDLERIGRWICVDNGSDEADLERMAELYPFLEIVRVDRNAGRHAEALNRIMAMVRRPYWLHIEDDWHFFAPERYAGRAIEILEDDPALAQVAFNFAYGEIPDDRCFVGPIARRVGGDGRRYMLHRQIEEGSEEWLDFVAELDEPWRTTAFWPHYTLRPSLIRIDALRPLGPFDPAPTELDPTFSRGFEFDYARRFEAAGLRTAFFDEIVALHIGRLTTQPEDQGALSAYDLADDHEQVAGSPLPAGLDGLDVTLINLDRRPDRLATVSAALKRAAGAEFASRCRRYAAVDGKDLVLDDELRHLFRGNDFGFRRGVVGCALSHLGVWREVIEAGRPRLILEDDVEFAAHFAERLADLLEVASQLDDVADVIQLGYFPWVNRANDDLFLPRDHPPLTAMRWDRFLGGTFGYVLYPEGARKLIEIAERDGVQRGIDVFLRDQHPAVRTLEAVPHLVLSQVALAGNGVDSDSQHDMTPVASPGAAGSPVAVKVLADLAASTKVGELRIDVVPAWPVAGLSISSDADGFTLLARTEEPGGDGAASYRVALAEDLAIAAIDPLREPDPQLGGSDPPATPAVSVPGGRLAVISESRGPRAVRHRFVLLGAEDEVTARSEAFTFVNAPGAGSEACGGIAERGGRLVIAFTVGESVSGLAVLSLDEALRTLGPVR